MKFERPAIVFTCCECGLPFQRSDDKRPDPLLCIACLILPGWFGDPGLRKAFAPRHNGIEAGLKPPAKREGKL